MRCDRDREHAEAPERVVAEACGIERDQELPGAGRRAFGVEIETISVAEAQRRHPLLDAGDAVGAVYLPGDGQADPGIVARYRAAVRYVKARPTCTPAILERMNALAAKLYPNRVAPYTAIKAVKASLELPLAKGLEYETELANESKAT